jgi:GMP synthase-like glutamine amidotransferase
MRIHHLQHVPFEGLGSMEPFLKTRGHQLSVTHLYLGQTLPDVGALDWLIVMGGPMGVHDMAAYPWLVAEKALIRDAIASGKIVLGICLGAQLIADVLGAGVTRNKYREIGWFPLHKTEQAGQTIIGDALPSEMDVFHWHGDTFDIPKEAVHLAFSEACQHQGFIYRNRVVGFQFHLETTQASAKALTEHCGNELDGSRYVQDAAAMLSDETRFDQINQVMFAVLTRLESTVQADNHA